MTKLGQDTLVDAVQEELVTYLQDGTINERDVARTLDITNLGIESLDRLKRIHFCLSEDIVSFIKELDGRLRRIKTANLREREISRGEIRGSIDWQATTRLRYSEAIGDRTQFACKTPYTEYDIPENLVLKKLLWVIHSTVQQDLSAIEYGWRSTAWPESRIAKFERTYARNVHLNRIRDGPDIDITRRMLNSARTARQSLYSDAYRYYDRYRRLQSGDYADDDVSRLLTDTLVIPERLPKLFELFCIFRLLRSLRTSGLRLNPIEPGSEPLASLENDECTIEVYHDSGGNLSFYVPLSELDGIEEDYVERIRNVQERHQILVDEFTDQDTRQSLFNGRPDIVLEIYESPQQETLDEVVLGEIKYSGSQQMFKQGLEELLEYIEFAQEKSYLVDQGIDVHGILITDGAETNRRKSADGRITHLSASELVSDDIPPCWLPRRLC